MLSKPDSFDDIILLALTSSLYLQITDRRSDANDETYPTIMSTAYNHPQPLDLGGNVLTDASATTIKPIEGAPQDATHAPMTVIVDPNVKPEKMSFKEQVSLVSGVLTKAWSEQF
jgi:hypothetical protein